MRCEVSPLTIQTRSILSRIASAMTFTRAFLGGLSDRDFQCTVVLTGDSVLLRTGLCADGQEDSFRVRFQPDRHVRR